MAELSGGGLRVLIVEDNPGDAHLARRTLREIGADVQADHVESLTAAEDVGRRTAYDVILLDLSLPEGFGSVIVARARSLAPDTPIVVLTGHAEDATLTASLEADADDFLPKSDLAPVSLERAIRHARQRRRLALQVRDQQQQIHTAAERLRTILSAVSEGIVVLDLEDRVMFANPAFAAIMGSTADRVVGSRFPHIADNGVLVIDVEGNGLLEGGRRHVEVTSVPITWDGVDARVATLRDVTDRLEVEERLHAAQRMDAVGQLAGGMAHEINNVLAVVLANVALLQDLAADETARDIADDIGRSARRGKALLKRLLAVGRRQRLDVGTIDLGTVVRDLGETLRRMLPLNLALDVRVPDSPACARADASAIEQILLNLVNNARDATPDGGRVAVEVEIVEVSEQLAQSHSGMVQGSYVRLTVRDDGTGMRDDVRARAFEPFFTTKARGHGVGLGLSTVYGLAKQLGGFVYLSSEPQAGATATLFFPHAPDVVAYDAAPSAGDRSDLGGATILVVEDEEPLRRATARVLKRLGYAVVEARNGLEALDVLRERPSDVDLVLSDVVMPDLGGRGLYDAMQELPGRPPVLFVSGYSAEDLRDGDLLDPSFDLLQKPWAIPELIDGIRRALAAGPAPREELVGGRRY